MKYKMMLGALTVLVVNMTAGCSDQGAATPTKLSPPPAEPAAIKGGEFVSQTPIQIASQPTVKGKSCALDTVNQKSIGPEQTWQVKKGAEVFLSGWAFDSVSKLASEELFIRLSGNGAVYYAVTTSRGVREDVSKLMGAAAALKTGFELRANTTGLAPGAYQAAILQPMNAGIVECTIPGQLIVE